MQSIQRSFSDADEALGLLVYDYRLGLKTSYTGKDLLFTRLRGGNMDEQHFQLVTSPSSTLLVRTGNTIVVDRLWYKFPIGSEFTAIVGAKARNTESLGMKPSAYNVKTLNMFGGQWGTGNVHNKETGGLLGLIWKQKVAKGEPAFTAALNYVADEGEEADSN